MPAYGIITISNSGAGATWTWTYDPAFWACHTEITGQSNAPTEIVVLCQSGQGDSLFTCPNMVLTTHTEGLAARAGGMASCDWGVLDTGVISGVNTAQRAGDLGTANEIDCHAYGGGLPLIPPYTVTCNEPGLPTIGG